MFRKLLLILTVAGLLTGAGLSTAQDSTGTATVDIVNASSSGIVVNVAVDGKPGAATLEFPLITTLTLEPGAHTVALSATGAGKLSGAIGEPIKLELKAGDDHFIVVMWTTPDTKALTATDLDIRAISDDTAGDDWTHITVNALIGAPTGQLMIDGKAYGDPVAYGEYGVTQVAPANYESVQFVAANDPKTVIVDYGPYFVEPSLTYVGVLIGKYPGELWLDYGSVNPESVARTNAWEFLSAFNRYTIGSSIFPPEYPYQHDDWKFTIFLKAVEAAGLKDLLTGDEPLTVFPPTDAAFARLPPGTLDTLMADPDAMKTLVENHIIQSFAGSTDGLVGAPLNMMGGAKPVASISDAGVVVVDGIVTGYGNSYHVTNGRVLPLDRVLLTDEGVATAETTP